MQRFWTAGVVLLAVGVLAIGRLRRRKDGQATDGFVSRWSAAAPPSIR